MNDLVFCPSCGHHLDAGADFCPNCGFNVKQYLAEQAQAGGNDSAGQNNEPEQPVANNVSDQQSVSNDDQATNNQQAMNDNQSNVAGNQPVDNSQQSDDQQATSQNQSTANQNQPIDNSQQSNTQNQPADNNQNQANNQVPNQNMNSNVPPVQNQSNNMASNQNPAPKRKSYRGLNTIFILIILLVAGYFWGNWYYGLNHQTKMLEEQVTSHDNDKMKNALTDENGQPLTDSQIGALQILSISKGETINKISQQIKSHQSGTNFSVQQVGHMLVFPKYKVVVKSRDVYVSTDIKNPKFSISGKSVSAKSYYDEYKLTGLTPGKYKLKVKNESGSKSKTKSITVGVEGNDNDVMMNTGSSDSDSDDTDTDTDNESEPTNSTRDDTDSSSSSTDTKPSEANPAHGTGENSGVVGDYTGDPDLSLNSDGTYTLGSKSGTYSVVENNNGEVKIRYNQDGGGSVTETYSYDGDTLHSDKYDADWVRD